MSIDEDKLSIILEEMVKTLVTNYFAKEKIPEKLYKASCLEDQITVIRYDIKHLVKNEKRHEELFSNICSQLSKLEQKFEQLENLLINHKNNQFVDYVHIEKVELDRITENIADLWKARHTHPPLQCQGPENNIGGVPSLENRFVNAAEEYNQKKEACDKCTSHSKHLMRDYIAVGFRKLGFEEIANCVWLIGTSDEDQIREKIKNESSIREDERKKTMEKLEPYLRHISSPAHPLAPCHEVFGRIGNQDCSNCLVFKCGDNTNPKQLGLKAGPCWIPYKVCCDQSECACRESCGHGGEHVVNRTCLEECDLGGVCKPVK